jgi:zinc-ribbon domain
LVYCQYCGKKVDDNEHFCKYCGKPLAHAPNTAYTPQTVQPSPPTTSNRNKPSHTLRNIVIALGVIFVVIIAIVSISLSGSPNAGSGTNNQVTVSGTITLDGNNRGVIYFANINGSFETSCAVTNGHYSVLLLGGQSYHTFDYNPNQDELQYTDYNPFYVPSGVTTFTENLTPSS